jgi:hypothetical protein
MYGCRARFKWWHRVGWRREPSVPLQGGPPGRSRRRASGRGAGRAARRPARAADHRHRRCDRSARRADLRAIRPARRCADPAQHARFRGTVLAATFIANTGGDLRAFETVDRLASVAGLAPAPRDSGRISGNHHRPRRFNRRLMRTCYLAALSSLKNSPAARSMTASAPKARTTSKHSSPSPGDGSPRSGRCFATAPHTRNRPGQHWPRPLDNSFIEIPYRALAQLIGVLPRFRHDSQSSRGSGPPRSPGRFSLAGSARGRRASR